MVFDLITLALLLAYLAYDARIWKDRRVDCPSCGKHTVCRVVSCGLPGWYCESCETADGLFVWADDLIRDPDSETAGPFFNGELFPFAAWYEFPETWWCWATHRHDDE